MRILLLEDDPDLAEVMALGLRKRSYATDVARTCSEATELLTVNEYDVACVDLGLPDGDGLDLVRRLSRPDATLRRPRRTILVTARDAVADRVAGLDAGADDYLVKPFDFDELLARLRALGRRAEHGATTLVVGDIEVDQAAASATRAGRPLDLTAREFALLRYLALHAGEVVSSEQLLEHVWDANADPFTTSVRVIMSRLRRKLGSPPVIDTVTGAGYRLEAG